MTTTWLLILAAALLATAIGFYGPSVVNRMDRFGSWSPLVREMDKKPAAHEGATEAYGAELHNAAKKLPSPDLIRPAEQMVADHEALHAITIALDDFDRTVSDAISRFLRNQPTVLLRLPSSIEHTGEMPVVELAVAS